MTNTGETQDEDFRDALGRLVRQLLKEDQGEQRGTPMLPVLDAHFGQPADDLPVVQESIDAHRVVDVDIALAEIGPRP